MWVHTSFIVLELESFYVQYNKANMTAGGQLLWFPGVNDSITFISGPF